MSKAGAGARDNELPHGIFLKTSSDDIGIKGSKQMSLYANISNPLSFTDRIEARNYWKKHIEGYDEIIKLIEENDRLYGKEFDEAFDKSMPSDKSQSTEQRESIEKKYEKIADEILSKWQNENESLDKQAKDLIDEYLANSEYDGIHLLKDNGSYNRKIETYIAFESNQVKEMTNLNPSTASSIRFSRKEGYTPRYPLSVKKSEYEHHYWATVNNVLARNELGQLNKAIGDIKNGDYYPQTADGEYMITVGNARNKIIFTDGKYESYSISKVIEILETDEDNLDTARSNIYEFSTIGISEEDTPIFKVYTRDDVSFNDFKRKLGENARNSSIQQDGRGSSSEDEGGNTPNKKGVKYSKKKTNYLSYESVGQEVVRDIRSQLSNIYDGISDGIADGIAIERGNTIYIVDSGIDNGDIRFGIIRKRVISDNLLRNQFVRRTNDDAIRKGYVSDGLSSRFGNGYDNDRTSDRRQESGKKLSANKEQPQNNDSGIYSGDTRRRGIKYSLKENAEQEILDYYGKTYKWSETVHEKAPSQIQCCQLKNFRGKIINR